MCPILAMPTTTVQKMIGAIIILISLINASPRGFSACAVSGNRNPTATPMTMPQMTRK